MVDVLCFSLGLFFLVLYELMATCDVAPEGISDQLMFSQLFFTPRFSPLLSPHLPQCLLFAIRSLCIALRPPTKRCIPLSLSLLSASVISFSPKL